MRLLAFLWGVLIGSRLDIVFDVLAGTLGLKAGTIVAGFTGNLLYKYLFEGKQWEKSLGGIRFLFSSWLETSSPQIPLLCLGAPTKGT